MHAASPPERPAHRGVVTFRSVLIGCLLAAGLLAVTPYNDYFICGSYMANHHVPVAASFVLLALCLAVNPVLRRLGRRELRLRELVIIWAMMAVSSGIASAGLMRFLVPTLPALHYFASPENKWDDILHPHIPAWLAPDDEHAVRWFYDGSPPGFGVPWGAWAGPVVAWSLAAVLMWAVLLALATLLRRQWIDHERMTFVHVQFPMALIETPAPGRALNTFFSDRLMWIGFAVPVLLYGIIGLGNYYPAIPKISVIYPNYYANALRFEGLPWNAVNPIYFGIFPSSTGFGFLLTTEVSMSAWVFFILFKLEAVLFTALGLQLRTVATGYGAKQFTAYQDMGVYLALICIVVYLARRHLREAWHKAIGQRSGEGDEAAYRAAIFGGCAALVLLVLLAGHAGLSAPVAVAFFVGYFMVCTCLSWVTSNTGVLQLPVVFRPEDYLLTAVGTRALAQRDLALLAIPSRAFTFYYNEMQMPHYLNNYKLAGETDTPRGPLVGAMTVAVLVGLAVAWVAQLALAYGKGAYAMQQMSYVHWPPRPFQAAATYITQPQGPDLSGFAFMAVGAAAFVGLTALRSRFVWWPLHPAGLLLGSTMTEMWFSLFIAWSCKTTILRYGGARAYQRARLFFLGMVAGEFTIACIWIAVGFVTGTGVRLLP